MQDRIAFAGKMCSGKTTIANMLSDEYGHEVLSFAAPIKYIAALMQGDHGGRVEHIYSYSRQIISDLVMATDFAHWVVRCVMPKERITFNLKDNIGRGILQKLGDSGRYIFGDNLWVDVLIRNLHQGKKYVVDDVRYPSEVDALKKAGFTILKLSSSDTVRQKRIEKLYGVIDNDKLQHRSETALEGFLPELLCDADAPEQYIQVKEALKVNGDNS